MLRRSLSVTILQYWSYNMAVFLPYGNVLDYFHDTCISLLAILHWQHKTINVTILLWFNAYALFLQILSHIGLALLYVGDIISYQNSSNLTMIKREALQSSLVFYISHVDVF